MTRRRTALALLLLSLIPRSAFADPTTGTGRDGPFVADREGALVNAYALVTEAAASGANTITLDDASAFASGDLALLWQPVADIAVTAGDPTAIALDGSPAGHHQLVRITARDRRVLTLATPLSAAIAAKSVQIVRVPEFTDVTIPASRSIGGRSWNGETGGLVALLASGTIHLSGAIDADAIGGRGGKLTNIAKHYGCAIAPPFDGSPLDGFAAKGEGVVHASWAPIGGKGNLANGAGGGNCHNGGGAGGGHIGRGGHGGLGWPGALDDGGSRDVGGLGGSPLLYDIEARWVFGAGGGAGESNNGTGTAGAAGGGVVYIGAEAIAGEGTIHANGGDAENPGPDGAGGGGAGGTVMLAIAGKSALSTIAAHGGKGGDAGDDPGEADGSGGGGGGGRIRVRAAAHEYSVDVGAGLAGTQSNATWSGGLHRGATPAASDDPAFVGLADRLSPVSSSGSFERATWLVVPEIAARSPSTTAAPDPEVLWLGSCGYGAKGRRETVGALALAGLLALLVARRG